MTTEDDRVSSAWSEGFDKGSEDVADRERQGREYGAARERRRIRRAQADALKELYGVRDGLPLSEARLHLTLYLGRLDAATRTPKKARTR